MKDSLTYILCDNIFLEFTFIMYIIDQYSEGYHLPVFLNILTPH